jgi:hypothetical protein
MQAPDPLVHTHMLASTEHVILRLCRITVSQCLSVATCMSHCVRSGLSPLTRSINLPARCANGQPFLMASSATAATTRPHSFTSFAISTASTRDRWSGASWPDECPSEAAAVMPLAPYAAPFIALCAAPLLGSEGFTIVTQRWCILDSKKLKASSWAAKYSACNGHDERAAELHKISTLSPAIPNSTCTLQEFKLLSIVMVGPALCNYPPSHAELQTSPL